MEPTSRSVTQRVLPVALIAIAMLLVGARIVSHVMKPKTEMRGMVRWIALEEAGAIARSTGKPILFDFTAEWCQPCHLLDAEVFQDPAIAREINARFVPVRVVDRQQEEGRNSRAVAALQQQYSVQGFPTIVFAGASGEVLGRMEGFRGRDEFQRVMELAR